MTKKIEPGMPCIIKGSLWNDGRIVIPASCAGPQVFENPDGSLVHDVAWIVEPQIRTHRGHSHFCMQRNLFPLDNPGDDEVDSLSVIHKHSLVKEH